MNKGNTIYRFLRAFLLSFRNTISMVNRDSMLRRWSQRYLLKRKPRLHHFEVHITDHCNLNCKGCGHYSNISPKWFASLSDYRQNLHNLKGFFSQVGQIYIMGGEPLLHPKVGDFLFATREIFPRSNIFLMTNALLLLKMTDSFWQALHSTHIILLCDDYLIPLPKAEIALKAQTFDVTVEWTPPRPSFFIAPLDITGMQHPCSSHSSCQGYSACPIIRGGKLYRCAPAAYSDILRAHFVEEIAEESVQCERAPLPADPFALDPRDSFDLSLEPTLKNSWAALDFLLASGPWCRYCDFTRFHYYPWERGKRTLDEWTC